MLRPDVIQLASEVATLGLAVLKADRPDRRVQPAEGPPNTYGLPEGDDIRRELIRWFREQHGYLMGEVLGYRPDIGAPLPTVFPDLADYDDPMASAMTPLISAYWDAAGKEARARIGLDPDAWRVTDPHLRAKIRTAAFNFCHATNQTTSLQLQDALDALKVELEEGMVDRGESLPELTKRVQGVFNQAETWRARRIAASEASRATHAAELESAKKSGVVVGLEWLASEDCCEKCAQIAAEVKRVPLGQKFAISGDNPTYRNIYHPPLHPGCQCSITEILDHAYGGPENPEWGETLNQPEGDEDAKPEPKPEARQPKTEFESDLDMIADARRRQRVRNAGEAKERPTIDLSYETRDIAWYRQYIAEQEEEIAKLLRDADANRPAWEQIQAERKKASERMWDFSVSKATRRKWEKRLKEMQPEYDRLNDLVAAAPYRVKAIRDTVDYYKRELGKALDDPAATKHYNFAELHKKYPDLIPPGEIQARIEAYVLGDAKIEAIQKSRTRAARPHAELEKERGRLNLQINDLITKQADLVNEFVAAMEPIPSEVQAQADAIQHQIDALCKAKQEIAAQQEALLTQHREEILRIIGISDGVTFSATDVSTGFRNSDDKLLYSLSLSTRERVTQAEEWLRKVVAPTDVTAIATQIGERAGARAHFSNVKDYIQADVGESTDVIIHEFGHAIDYRLKTGPDAVVQRSLEFLKHRVRDEAPTNLRDKFGTSFDAHEIGRKDEFDKAFSEGHAYYCGKDYDRDATEILSMGLQKLYNDPVGFAKNDPEYCKFILGICDGSLR